jgi:hypothetical protein
MVHNRHEYVAELIKRELTAVQTYKLTAMYRLGIAIDSRIARDGELITQTSGRL